MNLIVAVSKDNWCIGSGDELLVRISEDLKNFKKLTTGGAVVVGRRTFEATGVLPHRRNIVVTRDRSYSAPPGVIVAHDVADVKRAVRDLKSDAVWVIGGAQVYSMLVDHCVRAYVTEVDVCGNGDAFCVNLNALRGWAVVDRQPRRALAQTADGEREVDFAYVIYENLKLAEVDHE